MHRFGVRGVRIVGLASLLVAGLAMLLGGCDDKIERTIGDIAVRSIEQEYRVMDDPLLTEWMDVMGHRMVGYATRQDIPYTFRVIDTDMVNAFAAPYGHIYVTTGLLDFARTEDEVWGVVGHEIGHVVHRHAMSSLKRGLLYNIGLAILGSENRTLAEVAGIGLGLLSLKYSRGDEYQADDLGRQLSFAVGYDPRGTAEFFLQLAQTHERHRPSGIELMFRTHPASQNRADRQRAMPELSESNPDALLQTGRGYARRFQVRRAEALLAKAAELRPQDATTLLALADVQLQRGRIVEARSTLERAAQLQRSSYALAALRAATAAPEGGAPMSEGERQTAAMALADATVLRAAVASAAREVESRAAQVQLAARASVEGTHNIIDQLFGLTEASVELDRATTELVTHSNAVVSQALDPIYSLEQQRERLLRSAADLESVSQRLVAKLEAAQGGVLAAGEVAPLERALREARRAVDDIQRGLTELQAAVPAARAAQESAAEATQWVQRIMGGDTRAATTQAARQAAQDTEARGLTALAATRKSKQLVDRATVRALVARMNVAGAGVSPVQQRNLDGLVGSFLLHTPRAVKELRSEGIGYGDAALVLAAHKSVRLAPVELARLASGARSVVDQVSSAGARTEGALLLLKLLAAAMEYEVGE